MKAWISKGKIYFDEDAWALIKQYARKQHRSPKDIAMAGLRRGMIKSVEGRIKHESR